MSGGNSKKPNRSVGDEDLRDGESQAYVQSHEDQFKRNNEIFFLVTSIDGSLERLRQEGKYEAA